MDYFGRRLLEAQHLEHLLVIEVRGRPAAIEILGAASFSVAGAALGAPPARFAWQVQRLEHRGPRKAGDN